jgi:hypothetical protein
MDIAAQHGYQDARREEKSSAGVVTSGSTAASICGLGALALAIIGLAGAYPVFLVTIATIVAGAALMFEGGAISARVSKLMTDAGRPTAETSSVGGGMSAEFIAGIAGIALGIIALIGVVPGVLIPIAAIVFGGALLIGGGATASLNNLLSNRFEDTKAQQAIRGAIGISSGVKTLVGLGAIALGVLALIGVATLPLSLIAMLIVGAAEFVGGGAVSGMFAGMFRRA